MEDDLSCKQVLSNLEISNLNVPLKLDLNVLDYIKCFGDTTGIIAVSTESQNTPYDFNWSAGTKKIKLSNRDTLQNLPVGTYNVTITDNLGCVGESNSIVLSQPDKLEIENIDIENILCYGDNTGSVSISVSGGIPPYSTLWNNGEFGMDLTKLIAGEYSAYVSDSNDCLINTGLIEITQPDEITVTIESYPAHENKSDGYAIILPTGGVTPYKFLWDDKANFQTGNKAVNLSSGWYTVTLTDYNECIEEIKVFIAELPSDATYEYSTDAIKLFPNPAKDGIFVVFNNDDYSHFNFEIIDVAGRKTRPGFQYLGEKEVWIPVDKHIDGTYFLHIFNDKSHIYRRIVIIH